MKKLGNGSNNLDFFFGLVLVSRTHDVFCCCPRYVFSFLFCFFFPQTYIDILDCHWFWGKGHGKKEFLKN